MVLTLFNDFTEAKKFIDFKKIDSTSKSVVREAEKHSILALLRTKEADNIIKEQLNRMENDTKFHVLFLFKLKAYTEDMIQQGINIDTMSKLDFQLFIANKIYFWIMEEI